MRLRYCGGHCSGEHHADQENGCESLGCEGLGCASRDHGDGVEMCGVRCAKCREREKNRRVLGSWWIGYRMIGEWVSG